MVNNKNKMQTTQKTKLEHHLYVALEILWANYGNGTGSEWESLIAEIQNGISRLDSELPNVQADS